MRILLAFDEDFEIDRHRVVEFLNSKVNQIEFGLLESDLSIKDEYLTKPSSFEVISNQIGQVRDDYDRVFCFTDLHYADNYFFHEHNLLTIFSFSGWSHLTNLPKSNGLLYFIIDYLALDFDKSDFRHHEETGCIYDFLWSKTGIDDGMRQSKFCPSCLGRISQQISNESEEKFFEDLKNLMNSLSNSSKWNKNVLDESGLSSKGFPKRNSKKPGVINVVIASPGDTFNERKQILDRLEIQFRKGNHEAHCKKRLIVHGWEDLASQNGYPQDVINQKVISEMDFVIAIFRHKLGTPTKDVESGKIRAKSGTAEELMQALDYSKKDHPLGMAYFFSKAPIISLDSPDKGQIEKDWKRLERFKRSIQDKMIYKPFIESKDLMETILIDLEKNITDNFL